MWCNGRTRSLGLCGRGSIPLTLTYASLAELVYALVLETSEETHVGSTPTRSTYMVIEVKLVRRCAVNTVIVSSRLTDYPYTLG